MKITFLGNILDNTKEHELFSPTKFKHGYDVKVKFAPISNDFRPRVFNNCTEVHYMYERPEFLGKAIAFESDIHHIGNTYNIESIESVEITEAIEEHIEF